MVGLALASLGTVLSSSAMASAAVETTGGIKLFNPSDESYWFSLGGRLNLDETIFSGNRFSRQNNYPNGANIRRAFLKFMGGVGDCWTYNLTLNFTGSEVKLEDAWANYSGFWEGSNFRVGQFTPLTTIDGWGSYGTNNDGMFLEPSLATVAFCGTSWYPGIRHTVPNKALGLWVDTPICDIFTVGLTVYQPQQNPTTVAANVPSANNFQNPGRSDRLGAAARVTFAPVHTEDTVYHLGLLGRYQSMNNTNNGVPVAQTNLFNTIPEGVARNTSTLINTGNIRARSYNVVAVEALGLWGPVTIEGEFRHANVQRLPITGPLINPALQSGNVRFEGWHVQGGYVITGESRDYRFETGTLRNPKPCGDYGAWEIAARYSEINLVDKSVYGGSEHNVALGLNWFINENVKIAANYIRANIRATNPGNPGVQDAAPKKRHLSIYGLRFQVVF